MEHLNLMVGWLAILCGMLSGVIHGLCFHRADWLGGYATWPRRLTRLGHISFFGLAFVNLAFAWSVPLVQPTSSIAFASWALVIGTISMPLCCYLAAFIPAFRHAFVAPVVSLITGVSVFIVQGLWS